LLGKMSMICKLADKLKARLLRGGKRGIRKKKTTEETRRAKEEVEYVIGKGANKGWACFTATSTKEGREKERNVPVLGYEREKKYCFNERKRGTSWS